MYFPLTDEIYRCEKCFPEAVIQDTVIEKNKLSIYLSYIEYGPLITRKISPIIYDKISYAWDTKDIRKKEKKT